MTKGHRILLIVLLFASGGFAQSLPPAITSLTPAMAPFYGAPFTLTVNGQNFDSGSHVSLAGNPLATSFVNTSQLTAIVPTPALANPGVTSVTVISSGGVVSNSVDLRIVGRGDINASGNVNIGDALVTALTVAGLASPALPDDVGDINLSGATNIGDALVLALFSGRLTGNLPTPAITSVSSSPAVCGNPLTITGTGFTANAGDHQVLFTTAANGVIRVVPTAAGSGTLTVTVPSQAVSGPIQVYRLDTPMGSPEFPLNVSGTPTPLRLTSISPFFNVATGGSVTLTGLGFDPDSSNDSVLFRSAGGLVAGTIRAATATSLMVDVPAQAVCGGVSVATGSNISNQRSIAIHGTTCPFLLTDILGGGAPGDTLVIEGTGFDVSTPGANVVTFAGTGGVTVTAPVLQSGGTQLQVRIPGNAVAGNVNVTLGAQSSNILNFVPGQPIAPSPPPQPALASISASSGIQGQVVQATLTGSNFVPGAMSVTVSGSGIGVGTIILASPTTLTTTFSIDGQALAGARGVTVTTVGGSSNALTFTVLAIPALSSVTPALGLAGTAVPVTIAGSGFLPGATTLIASGTDVIVSAVNVTTSTTLTALFTIPAGATNGFRDVRVTTAGGNSNALSFVVGCAIVPESGVRGTTVPITLTGAGFVTGTTTLTISGTGITIGGLGILTATTLNATLTIGVNAPAGAHVLTVTTGVSNASVPFWVAATQVTDNSIRVPPDYYSFLPPSRGNSYVDPVFGSTIKRMSDANISPDIAYGAGFLPFISDEYSTMTPFNSDNSKVLALHFSYFGLYAGIFDTAGNFIKDLPFAVSASTEPRWSRSDPNILYFVNGNQLKTLDVSTDAISVLHTFSQYTSVEGKGESDISFDGDHFVLVGSSRYVFVYEISTDSTGPAFDTGGVPFDSLYITPDNNVTITWYDEGTARYNGIELFDRNMNFLRQVARAGGHMDVTRDTNGDEVLVWINAADPQATCPNSVVKIRLSTAQQTCLLTLDQSLAVHISATDNSGWFFMDTYAPSDPNPASAGWAPYTNEILEVKLDGTQVRRLAHHRSRPFDTYNYQPRASTSRDGSRIVFTSNYGLQSILGFAPLYSDIYLLVLSDPPIVAQPSSFSLSFTQGDPASSVNLKLSTTPEGMTGTAVVATQSGGNWLKLNGQLSASWTTSQTLSVSFDPTGLAPGTYNGSITLSSPLAINSPVVVPVSMQVTAPVGIH